MADDEDTHADMTKPARRVHGPRPIAALVPAIARPALRRMSPTVTHLLEAWPDIVGPALALVTTPRRLAQGTLTIACSGPVAMELRHLSVELMARLNGFLGTQAVRHLRFVHDPGAVPTIRPRQVADPAVGAMADAAVAELPSGPVRDALAALGRAVLAESTSRLAKQPHRRH